MNVTASDGWELLQLLGDGSIAATNFQVHMTRNKAVEAIFGTKVSKSSLVTISPESTLYPFGTRLRLTAIPPVGTYFFNWAGDIQGTDNPMSFEIASAEPTILFQISTLAPGQSSLAVVEDGCGQVTASPPMHVFSSGETVTLTANPEPGQEFLGWSGNAAGSGRVLSVTMDSTRVITGHFTKRSRLRVGGPLEGFVENGFRLTVNSQFGRAYSVLRSTNFVDWTVVGSVTNTYGVGQVIDSDATAAPFQFYRAREE